MLLSQDLPILLTLMSAAITAILAGSLLLPRGQIMISEAASHAVLPGLVLGFVLSGDHGWAVLLGAVGVIAGFVAATGWLRTRHALGQGVEIAALFPIFFGVGILLLSATGLEDTGAIDVDHILFGSLELLLWFDVLTPADLIRSSAWAGAPTQMVTALVSMVLAVAISAAAYPFFHRSLMDRHHARLITPVGTAVARVLETVLIALAAAACLRSAGVVVAIALVSAPVIAAWSFARSLWQVWVCGIVCAAVGLALTYATGALVLSVFEVEPRLSGVLALWLVVLALLAPWSARMLGRSRRAVRPLP